MVHSDPEIEYLREVQREALEAATSAATERERMWHFLGAQDYFVEEMYALYYEEGRCA